MLKQRQRILRTLQVVGKILSIEPNENNSHDKEKDKENLKQTY